MLNALDIVGCCKSVVGVSRLCEWLLAIFSVKAHRWMCLSFYQQLHLCWKALVNVLEVRLQPIVKPIQKNNSDSFMVAGSGLLFHPFV